MTFRKNKFTGATGNGIRKHESKVITSAVPVKMGRVARRKLERLERKASRNPAIYETVASKFCE